jgi:hypothetical protein
MMQNESLHFFLSFFLSLSLPRLRRSCTRNADIHTYTHNEDCQEENAKRKKKKKRKKEKKKKKRHTIPVVARHVVPAKCSTLPLWQSVLHRVPVAVLRPVTSNHCQRFQTLSVTHPARALMLRLARPFPATRRSRKRRRKIK